jgi:hypothetical protein
MEAKAAKVMAKAELVALVMAKVAEAKAEPVTINSSPSLALVLTGRNLSLLPLVLAYP